MAILPPFLLDSVTAIGVGDKPTERSWIGTGFLYGRFEKKDGGVRSYHVFLVTNKHVLKGWKEIYLKFNSAADTTSKDYEIALVAKNGKQLWVGHPDDDVDVAVIGINAD